MKLGEPEVSSDQGCLAHQYGSKLLHIGMQAVLPTPLRADTFKGTSENEVIVILVEI